MQDLLLRGALMSFIVFGQTISSQAQEQAAGGRITISGAWALYPMAVKWAEEFQKAHPEIKIDISAGGAGKGMADCLSKVVDLGMVSRDINAEEVRKGAWSVAVTKDAVVATINQDNPVLKELLAQGLTKEMFTDIFITGKIKKWGEAVKTGAGDSVAVYTRSDACGAAETWAKYLGKKQEDIMGIGVYGDPGVAEAVKKDKSGIGYNNINFAYDAKTKKMVDGIRVVPIDLNGNGKIDSWEDVYKDLNTINAAIADGRYPSPPARELFFVAKGCPESRAVRVFLRWVLTDGQAFVPEAGFINVSKERIDEDLQKLGKD
ncbi:MAG: substrate-binding domain-containing protein [Candidatus Omnitrophica bacterium]|nr:substrate-binding domain-containing protein [Candidatus Omnitrophota bacterium]